MRESTPHTPVRDDEARLFEGHAGALHAVVSRRVPTSPVNVEDACGFAWLQLVCHRPRPVSAFAWLCTTAIREAVKLHRRTSWLVALDELDEAAADPRGMLEGRLELMAAGQQLGEARLRPREARLVGLRVAGYSREEMSELTGETCRTLDRQLGRAQRKLRVARRAEAEVR
jgi:DNA-directed RNA polymerase specialized sigma24 family protein